MNKRLTGVALTFFLAIQLIAQQPNTDDPNSVPSQCVAGVDYQLSLAALQGSDDTEPAMKQADECVRRYPALADAWIRRGHLHVNRNEYDAALADFSKAIELDPKNADTYNSRAWVYGAKDNFASAYADYDKALTLDANSIDAYIGRGDLHRMKSEEAQARAEYNKAIEVADTGNGLYFVGGAYLGRGLLEMSRMNWAAAEKDLSLAIKETFGPAEQAYSQWS